MKIKVISFLLYIGMATMLLNGCANNEISKSSQLDSAITEDTKTEESDVAKEAVVDTITQTPFENLTPEEQLQRVLDNYNILAMKGYTRYYGHDWDTIALDEVVQIDTASQIISVEKYNAETGAASQSYISREDGNEYVYIQDAAHTDGYVKVTGHNTLTYEAYTAALAVPTESTAEYEINDFSILVSEPYEYKDGISALDVSVFYEKKLTDSTGVAVELDVTDIFTVTADTQSLLMRITETTDLTNEESSYNFVAEISYVTGTDANSLSNALPGYVYGIEPITYDAYLGL